MFSELDGKPDEGRREEETVVVGTVAARPYRDSLSGKLGFITTHPEMETTGYQIVKSSLRKRACLWCSLFATPSSLSRRIAPSAVVTLSVLICFTLFYSSASWDGLESLMVLTRPQERTANSAGTVATRILPALTAPTSSNQEMRGRRAQIQRKHTRRTVQIVGYVFYRTALNFRS